MLLADPQHFQWLGIIVMVALHLRVSANEARLSDELANLDVVADKPPCLDLYRSRWTHQIPLAARRLEFRVVSGIGAFFTVTPRLWTRVHPALRTKAVGSAFSPGELLWLRPIPFVHAIETVRISGHVLVFMAGNAQRVGGESLVAHGVIAIFTTRK